MIQSNSLVNTFIQESHNKSKSISITQSQKIFQPSNFNSITISDSIKQQFTQNVTKHNKPNQNKQLSQHINQEEQEKELINFLGQSRTLFSNKDTNLVNNLKYYHKLCQKLIDYKLNIKHQVKVLQDQFQLSQIKYAELQQIDEQELFKNLSMSLYQSIIQNKNKVKEFIAEIIQLDIVNKTIMNMEKTQKINLMNKQDNLQICEKIEELINKLLNLENQLQYNKLDEQNDIKNINLQQQYKDVQDQGQNLKIQTKIFIEQFTNKQCAKMQKYIKELQFYNQTYKNNFKILEYNFIKINRLQYISKNHVSILYQNLQKSVKEFQGDYEEFKKGLQIQLKSYKQLKEEVKNIQRDHYCQNFIFIKQIIIKKIKKTFKQIKNTFEQYQFNLNRHQLENQIIQKKINQFVTESYQINNVQQNLFKQQISQVVVNKLLSTIPYINDLISELNSLKQQLINQLISFDQFDFYRTNKEIEKINLIIDQLQNQKICLENHLLQNKSKIQNDQLNQDTVDQLKMIKISYQNIKLQLNQNIQTSHILQQVMKSLQLILLFQNSNKQNQQLEIVQIKQNLNSLKYILNQLSYFEQENLKQLFVNPKQFIELFLQILQETYSTFIIQENDQLDQEIIEIFQSFKFLVDGTIIIFQKLLYFDSNQADLLQDCYNVLLSFSQKEVHSQLNLYFNNLELYITQFLQKPN